MVAKKSAEILERANASPVSSNYTNHSNRKLYPRPLVNKRNSSGYQTRTIRPIRIPTLKAITLEEEQFERLATSKVATSHRSWFVGMKDNERLRREMILGEIHRLLRRVERIAEE